MRASATINSNPKRELKRSPQPLQSRFSKNEFTIQPLLLLVITGLLERLFFQIKTSPLFMKTTPIRNMKVKKAPPHPPIFGCLSEAKALE